MSWRTAVVTAIAVVSVAKCQHRLVTFAPEYHVAKPITGSGSRMHPRQIERASGQEQPGMIVVDPHHETN